MRNRRSRLAGVACLLLAVAVTQARNSLPAPPPTVARVATADLVIVGKVTGFADKTVKGEMHKGDERQMQIALVKVGDTLMGKAGKEVKVGFFPPVQEQPQKDGIRVFVRPSPSVQLKQDMEACLILVKHPTIKDVYIAANYYDAVAKKDNPNFDKELGEIKKGARLLEKPADNLKSKDADERYLTAALLILRYRNQKGGEQKTEEIAADESKLILEALADADWASKQPKFGSQLTPRGLFHRLGATDKDGWQQPKDNTRIVEEAKKWCKDNAGKYKIKRFVSEEKAEVKGEK